VTVRRFLGGLFRLFGLVVTKLMASPPLDGSHPSLCIVGYDPDEPVGYARKRFRLPYGLLPTYHGTAR
jgi:hypothetical protein